MKVAKDHKYNKPLTNSTASPHFPLSLKKLPVPTNDMSGGEHKKILFTADHPVWGSRADVWF